MRLRRSTALLLTGTFALALGSASLAWACGGQATLGLSTASGAPGSAVGVTGALFPADAAVNIHWGSVSGPVVATATGPSFSVSASVPATATVGVHYVVAVSGSSQATRAFRVATGSAESSAPGGTAELGADGPVSDLPVSAAPPAVAPAEEAPAPPVRVAASRPAPSRVTTAPAVVVPAPAPAETAAPAAPVAPALPSDVGAPIAPAPATVSADLWSGFRSGATDGRAMFDSTGSESSTPALVFGIGFVVVGMALLGGGVALVVSARRRHVDA